MKKIIFSFMIVCLSGCAAVDAYLMGSYDPNEYHMITTIRYDAHTAIASCADPVQSKLNANTIAYNTGLYALYESERPHNADSITASTALDVIAQGLKKRYDSGDKVSELYCRLKFGEIDNSATLIQHVQGKRPS